jgi:hypothetical protein
MVTKGLELGVPPEYIIVAGEKVGCVAAPMVQLATMLLMQQAEEKSMHPTIIRSALYILERSGMFEMVGDDVREIPLPLRTLSPVTIFAAAIKQPKWINIGIAMKIVRNRPLSELVPLIPLVHQHQIQLIEELFPSPNEQDIIIAASLIAMLVDLDMDSASSYQLWIMAMERYLRRNSKHSVQGTVNALSALRLCLERSQPASSDPNFMMRQTAAAITTCKIGKLAQHNIIIDATDAAFMAAGAQINKCDVPIRLSALVALSRNIAIPPPTHAHAQLELYTCHWPGCLNLEGDTEFAIKTYACDGCPCARRYCSRECQAADWRAGHKAVHL